MRACCDAKWYITASISILERVISAINIRGPNSPATRDDTRIFARTCRGPWKITRSHLSFRGRKERALPSSKFWSALFSLHSDSSPATRASANGRWRIKKEEGGKKGERESASEKREGKKKSRTRECILTTRGISHWSARCTRAHVLRCEGTGRVCDEVTNIPLVDAAICERQRIAVPFRYPSSLCSFVSRYSRYMVFREICIEFSDSVSSNRLNTSIANAPTCAN